MWILEQLKSDIDKLAFNKPIQLSGRVSRFDGHIIECDGFRNNWDYMPGQYAK